MEETKSIQIHGISCYEKGGIAYLKLEAVARGLGFTKTESKNGVEYTTVRWERVFGFLDEFSFDHKRAKDMFIPENIFYRLAMKAKNPAAEAFQAKVADEIIPAIRRTGSYSAIALSPAEQLLAQAKIMVEQERRISALEEQTQQTSARITDVVSAFSVPVFTKDHWQEQANQIINRIVEVNHLNHQQYRHKLYEELERAANCNLEMRKKRMQSRMRNGGAKYADVIAVSKLAIIAADAKLRAIFEGILRREAALCIAG